jgi:hypothetical protein
VLCCLLVALLQPGYATALRYAARARGRRARARARRPRRGGGGRRDDDGDARYCTRAAGVAAVGFSLLLLGRITVRSGPRPLRLRGNPRPGSGVHGLPGCARGPAGSMPSPRLQVRQRALPGQVLRWCTWYCTW